MVELNCVAKVQIEHEVEHEADIDRCLSRSKKLIDSYFSPVFKTRLVLIISNMDEHEEEKGEDMKSMLENAIEHMEMRIDRLEQQRASSSSSAESSSRPTATAVDLARSTSARPSSFRPFPIRSGAVSQNMPSVSNTGSRNFCRAREDAVMQDYR